ncbi:MAG: ABC transporter substrate-binding protein, partial [Gammaproteobacteria bacterium]
MRLLGLSLLLLMLGGCGEQPWNNPYPAAEDDQNIMYASFRERPKHLDPARSYSANEYQFIGQIYEPPLQYHYLKRPYTLVPLAAAEMPKPRFYTADGREVDGVDGQAVAYSVYDIHIRPGIRYQPHPAFARDAAGAYLYHQLGAERLKKIYSLADFPETGSRELVAADYVYQIKRLAHPRLFSPIFGIMSDYIVGLKDYAARLEAANRALRAAGGSYLDLTRYPLEGAEVLDRYTYRIKVRGKYPQLRYWLAMPFFAPLPAEADRFYSQPGMAEKNLTLDWYPVGTGPYMLIVNDPNRRMVLARNPNFHGERYPLQGQPEDAAAGLLADAGRALPFIDKVMYSLEKEDIPYWNKFLQGYYDTSGITSDSFDQAVRVGGEGEVALTDAMRAKGIQLLTAVNTSIFYLGFNMLDPVVGDYGERQRKLRQALSIALDYEEYISIFANGRGIPAQGPIPPGIFGFVAGRAGINPYVYEWRNGHPRRKAIAAARRLLAEAGYSNGVDQETGKPLVLYFDVTAMGPDDKARLEWYRKQFQKLDIQLVVRSSDYNRFQDKLRNGNAQIFIWGWNADYPDPENFLFLLYGPNGKARHHGENAANYANPEFDRLFEVMKNMDNGPQRQAIIDEMVAIVRRDAPWAWGFHPKGFSLYH